MCNFIFTPFTPFCSSLIINFRCPVCKSKNIAKNLIVPNPIVEDARDDKCYLHTIYQYQCKKCKQVFKIEMFNNINLINFWLFGWAAVGVIFVSSDLVGLCFGSDYIMSIEIPIVLALNIYMVGMQNAVWTYKNTMGIFHYGRFMQFGTAILNIFFSILLGNILGVFGILFASAIARALTNTWYDPYCVYKYGFKTDPKKYFKKYLKYLIIILIDVTACYGICLFIDFNYLINVILKIIICSLVTNIFFILCFKSTPEYSYIKRILLNIFYKLMKKIR